MKKIILTLIFCFSTLVSYADNLPTFTPEVYGKILRNSLQTLNRALEDSVHTNNQGYYTESIDRSKFYNNTYDIINKALIPVFNKNGIITFEGGMEVGDASMTVQKILYNGFIFNDNAKATFRALNNNCTTAPNFSGDYSKACAEVIIDVNGNKAPNKFTTDINNPMDKFRFLLYSDKVIAVPNSIEEQFMKLSKLNDIEIYEVMPIIITDIYNWNDTKTKFAIEIKFFNNKGEQIYSKVLTSEAEPNNHSCIDYQLDLKSLPHGITSYKIHLVEVL